MPQIRQYQATETVHADPTAASATASAASATLEGAQSAIGAINRGVQQVAGAIHERDVNAETSKLAADIATFNAAATVEWQRRTQDADPNDHELSSRFLSEYVEPGLAAIGESLETDQGRNLFERSAAGVRANLFVQSAADQTTLAGMAAVHNANTIVNQTASAAMANPSGLEDNLALFRTALEGVSGINGMNPAQRAQLLEKGENQIARASFMGAAQRNPAAALQELASGKYNTWFDGNETAQMRNYAEEVQRDAERQARANEEARIKANKAHADQFANQITASTIRDDGTLGIPADYFKNVRDLAMMPDVEPSLPRAMRSAGIAIGKSDPPLSDPHTYLDFLDRLGRSDVPMQEIYQARGEGRLNNKDFSFMLQWAKSLQASPQRRTQQQTLNTFFGGMKAFITKSNMLVADQDGNQRYSEYVRAMSARYWDGIAKGRDPEQMFSEFRNEVPQYQVPMGQSTDRLTTGIEAPNAPLPPVGTAASTAATITGTAAARAVPHTVPQRKPGESASAYLKRVGNAAAEPVAHVVPGGGALDEPEDVDNLDEESEE